MNDAALMMNKQYRYQRYVYDVSRKYYLLGRDQLLQEIMLQPGETLLEVGCGTGRNLQILGQRYPNNRLCGVDAAEVMLETARNKLATRGLSNITLRQGLAESWLYQDFALQQPFDHVVFSYSLSMMTDWQAILQHAINALAHGGVLHIVDFSLQRQLPDWFGWALKTWLAWFHVHPNTDMLASLQSLEKHYDGQLQFRSLYADYAMIAHFSKNDISLG